MHQLKLSATEYVLLLEFRDQLTELVEELRAKELIEQMNYIQSEVRSLRRLLDNTEVVWCTVREAATILNCTPGNIYHRVKDGTLVSKKIGGKVLVYKPALFDAA